MDSRPAHRNAYLVCMCSGVSVALRSADPAAAAAAGECAMSKCQSADR